MIIRDATHSDIENIIAGIEEFVASSSYRADPVNVFHVRDTLIALIDAPDGVVAVMEDDAGAFAGCFVGMAHAHLFSASRILAELFIYTSRAHRGHGGKLRRFAEDRARDLNCGTFLIAHPMSEGHLEKVYKRWGFEPHEVHYRKDLG